MKPMPPLLAIAILATALPSSATAQEDAKSATDAAGDAAQAAAEKPSVETTDARAVSENFENWNLEPGIAKAHLIMVARVKTISEVTVVEGAKTDVSMREFTFAPVTVLKGLFGRDELSMTAKDLGISASEAPPLKEGEYRLLILVQQSGPSFFGGIRSFGCVAAAPGATTFAQRVPLLAGADDPLVGVVETLIDVADSRSRGERAKLLIDRLTKTDGIAVVPLLTSLQARADWAAADGRSYDQVAPLAKSGQVGIRGAAVKLLGELLVTGIVPDDAESLEGVAKALRDVLESDDIHTSVRVAAIESLGYLLAMNDEIASWPRFFLRKQFVRFGPASPDNAAIPPGDGAPTYAERTAAVVALSHIEHLEQPGTVMNALRRLPLDTPPARESVYARAAVRRSAGKTQTVLLDRLEQSIVARQSLSSEVAALARLESKDSLPLLLRAARSPHVSDDDQRAIAAALGKLGDDRAVSVLVGWLRGDDRGLRSAALAALELIDSEAAARGVRPLLDSESRLDFKLRIARLLARHGIDDGYALATEHLADQTAAATLVLVALDNARTAADLSRVLESNPPRQWRAAALAGLAAIGDEKAKKELLEILSEDRHPLSAKAAEAAGLAGDPKLLRPLAELLQSRNKIVAMASLTALKRYLSGVRSSPRGLAAADGEQVKTHEPAAEIPPKTRTALAKAMAELAKDAYVSAGLREQALGVARLLGGEEYAMLLTELADQTALEGERLLEIVQAERRRLRIE